MGNGPSLNNMDLDRFEGVLRLGLESVLFALRSHPLAAHFYVSVDRRVTPDISSDINRLTRELTETTFFFPVRYRQQEVLTSASGVYWYDEVPPNPSLGPDGAFSTERGSERSTPVPTVTLAQMQLAVFLGFNPIYLIGCDTSYTVKSTVRAGPLGRWHEADVDPRRRPKPLRPSILWGGGGLARSRNPSA